MPSLEQFHPLEKLIDPYDSRKLSMPSSWKDLLDLGNCEKIRGCREFLGELFRYCNNFWTGSEEGSPETFSVFERSLGEFVFSVETLQAKGHKEALAADCARADYGAVDVREIVDEILIENEGRNKRIIRAVAGISFLTRKVREGYNAGEGLQAIQVAAIRVAHVLATDCSSF